MRLGVFVAVCLTACAALYLVAFARSAPSPVPESFLEQQASLERENVKLRRKNAKILKKLGRRERQVQRLHRAMRERVQFGSSGVVAGFLCIHQFEGAWNDPNAPYYGGLQMDNSFMSSYGGEFLRALGTADRWAPFLQVAVAMRAYYAGRGFGPWPNTRKKCGI